VACLLEVAGEFLLGVRAPLPDRAHLVRGQFLAPFLLPGALFPGGPAAARARVCVFAHERIIPHDVSMQKAQSCSAADSEDASTGALRDPGVRSFGRRARGWASGHACPQGPFSFRS
jgi:hypothetical protein